MWFELFFYRYSNISSLQIGRVVIVIQINKKWLTGSEHHWCHFNAILIYSTKITTSFRFRKSRRHFWLHQQDAHVSLIYNISIAYQYFKNWWQSYSIFLATLVYSSESRKIRSMSKEDLNNSMSIKTTTDIKLGNWKIHKSNLIVILT